MNMYSQVKVQTEGKSLVCVGFVSEETLGLDSGPNSALPTDPTFFPSAYSAFIFLDRQSRENPEALPEALLVDLDQLLEENFLLLTCLQRNPYLRTLPFIVVDRSEEDRRRLAFRPGVDDYFHTPLPGPRLRKRLVFLQRYKALLLNLLPQEEVLPSSTIPLGKRIFDLFFAGLALLAASPLMLLIALAIKLESRGPVIYRSKRVGSGYEVFDFFKFRTMYVDADKRLEELKHLNQYGKNGQPFLKIRHDPRVTRLGRVLRKTSLDELPQLFNVLRGDMSLVGNRPLPLYEAEQLTRDHWAQRFLAPAGLTGLWQVSKRGKKSMSAEERILLDVSYARNFSFLEDLKIILKTIPAMIQDEEV